MKNTLIIKLLITAILILLMVNVVDRNIKEKRLKTYNVRVDSLMNEGYTYRASVHISMVRGGWIKPDKEYRALMED